MSASTCILPIQPSVPEYINEALVRFQLLAFREITIDVFSNIWSGDAESRDRLN